VKSARYLVGPLALLALISLAGYLARPLLPGFWGFIAERPAIGLSFFICFGLGSLIHAKDSFTSRNYSMFNLGQAAITSLIAVLGADTVGEFSAVKFNGLASWLTLVLHVVPANIVVYVLDIAAALAGLGVLVSLIYVACGILSLTFSSRRA
jgi:hypothetical protein